MNLTTSLYVYQDMYDVELFSSLAQAKTWAEREWPSAEDDEQVWVEHPEECLWIWGDCATIHEKKIRKAKNVARIVEGVTRNRVDSNSEGHHLGGDFQIVELRVADVVLEQVWSQISQQLEYEI
jgi:hypothetical protein